MNYTEAVNLAKAGDERGFSFLYEKTYKSKYYLALQYTKDEESAKDVLQDAYLTAFSKLDTLKDPESFSAWFGKIVANTAINASKKKNPMLFSDVAVNEEDEHFEYQIEDDNLEVQPEIAYTRQETKELVHEMLDSLSEEQKVCVLLFHIEGISIREIAQMMNCSENTVKSRLNYGRKNLKARAEELQKKGYKLYGIAPLPLLLYLLRTDASYMWSDGSAALTGEDMEHKILEEISSETEMAGKSAEAASKAASQTAFQATAHTAAHTAAGAAKAGLFHTAAGKAAAIIVGACVIGGGAFGVYQVARNTSEPEPAQEETQLQEEPEETGGEEPAQEEQTPEVVVTEVQDADYPNLIEGNLTKEEMEFVLAYGPDEIPEGGIENSVQFPYLLPLLCQSEGTGEGPIEYYGTNSNGQVTFSLDDVNRLFSSFTDYQYSEDNDTDTEYGVNVDGNTIAYTAVTMSYAASADITSAEYTEDEMIINYMFERDYADPASEDIRSNKKAVLKPTENGLFRIVSIEEVDQSSQTAEADAEAGQNRTAESTQSTGSVKDAYTSVLQSISAHEPGFEFSIAGDSAESYEYFLQDMDGDGTEELIVGASVADGPFYVYDCRVFTLSQNGGTGLQPVGEDFSAMSLYIPSDGNGLFTYEFSRGTGEVYISRITISNGSLKSSSSESRFTMGDTSDQQFKAENAQPSWKDISDLSGLDGLS